MGKPGRKSWMEEMKLKQRYSDLSEEYFAILKKMMKSKDKNDRKWAVNELSKAFVKMIPQTVAGDEDSPLTFQVTGMKIVKDDDKDGDR